MMRVLQDTSLCAIPFELTASGSTQWYAAVQPIRRKFVLTLNGFQGKHFTLIQPEDLLLVDHDAQIQDGSGPFKMLNVAAFMIHSEIHKARPDVMCAAHSHSVYGRAFSTLGKELDPLTQDSCAFYKVGR